MEFLGGYGICGFTLDACQSMNHTVAHPLPQSSLKANLDLFRRLATYVCETTLKDINLTPGPGHYLADHSGGLVVRGGSLITSRAHRRCLAVETRGGRVAVVGANRMLDQWEWG